MDQELAQGLLQAIRSSSDDFIKESLLCELATGKSLQQVREVLETLSDQGLVIRTQMNGEQYWCKPEEDRGIQQ
jgi:Fe2+ or Zn2+ uptake regulation protein